MFDFFNQLIGYIEVVFNYLYNTVTSFIMALGFLATSLSFPQAILGSLPPIIASSVLCVMAVYVIRFLIGK